MERHTRFASGKISAAPQWTALKLADPPRNGLPPARSYTWNPGEAERRAEGAARLAAGTARANPPARPAAPFDPGGEATPPQRPAPPAAPSPPPGPRPPP